jgi:predicted PurR-regulated permease PerM
MDQPAPGPDKPRPTEAAAGPDETLPATGTAVPASDVAAISTERPRTGGLRRFEAPSQRVMLLVFSAIVVGVLLYAGREALGPFVVGLMFVYLLAPLVERLSRIGLPRWIAILITYALVVLVVVEGLNLTLRPLVQQVRDVVDDFPRLLGLLQAQLERVGAVYRGLELPPAIRDVIDDWLAGLAGGQIGFDPSVLLPILRATTGFVGTVIAFLIVPVWAFYLIKDRPQLTEAFDRSLPAEWRTDVHAILRIIERVFSQWVRGQLILGLTVIAGILELLPIIGPIIAAIPAILLAATAGLEAAGAAFLLYLAIQQLENNLLVPKIQGDAIELHPSAVMFALVVGGAIAGLLGAILSLPVTAAGRDVYRYLFRRLSEPIPPVTP